MAVESLRAHSKMVAVDVNSTATKDQDSLTATAPNSVAVYSESNQRSLSFGLACLSVRLPVCLTACLSFRLPLPKHVSPAVLINVRKSGAHVLSHSCHRRIWARRIQSCVRYLKKKKKVVNYGPLRSAIYYHLSSKYVEKKNQRLI